MKSHIAFGRSGVVLAVLLAGFAGACTKPHDPGIESRAKQVLDAQYAAKEEPKPMQASEADRIYENYLNNIGEPLESDGVTGE